MSAVCNAARRRGQRNKRSAGGNGARHSLESSDYETSTELFPWPPPGFTSGPDHVARPATWLRCHEKKRSGDETEYRAGGLAVGHRGRGSGRGTRLRPAGGDRRPFPLASTAPASILTLPRPPKVKSLGQLEFPKLFSPVTLAWLTPQLKASPSQGRPRETSLGFFF